MSHPDDEMLVAVATDETVPDDLLQHVVGCPSCAEAVATTRRVVSSARAVGTVPAWSAPPQHVWDAIVQQLDDEAQTAPSESVDHGSATPAPTTPAPASQGPLTHGPVTPLPARPGSPTRTSRVTRWAVGASAAGLLIGVLGTSVVDRANTPERQQVAAVALDTLDTKQPVGEARVVKVDGGVDLTIDTTPLTAEQDGYLEVWLINTDLKRMVSVGILGSGERTASFPISDELLAQGYTIVDISREPFDDKPQHSGDSVVRGRLKV